MSIKRLMYNLYNSNGSFVKKVMPVIILSLVLVLSHKIIFSNSLYIYRIDEYNSGLGNHEDLKIHFINVGQADCILIQQGNNTMIIDAGNDEDSDVVLKYIKEQNISKFDYVIGTHAHKDHIGSIDNVIRTYDIDNVFFPKQVHNTDVFKSFIKSVDSKNIQLYHPNVGEIFDLGNARFEIMAPNSSSYKESNDYSIVIKLTYKDNTFLFTGDAELVSENEMLANNLDISADLIKIGHHGGNTSTSKLFLDKVNPKYAVITSISNNYGYPSYKVMHRLKKANIQIYRTNEYGNILVTSDGTNITLYTNNEY